MEIYAHMEVVDTNDQHVGTVETVEGDRIRAGSRPANLTVRRS